ncbi:MAG: hypothetical protein U0V74_01810 [Chitinophagales bacterium]
MQAQDELFLLIKSLTSSEKRYFKVYAGRHVLGNKNNYEKLFDVIDSWPEGREYDEEELKDILRKKRLGKFLSADKVKLIAVITEAMRAYRSGSSIEQTITDLLADESFFKIKRLNRLRLKVIQKAKELAWKYELYPVLITVLQREAVAAIEWQQEHLGRTHSAIEKETGQAFEVLHLAVDLRRLYEKIFTQARTALNGSEKTMQLASETLESELIKKYKEGHSFTCDKLFYQTMALCHRLLFQFQEYSRFQQKVADLYETYTHFIDYDRTAYKITLYNLMNALIKNEQQETFQKYLNKAQNLKALDPDEEGEDWQNIIHLKLLFALNIKKPEDGCALHNEIETGLHKYQNKVNAARKIVLWSNLTACFLYTGRFEQALHYNNLILNDKSEARKDIRDQCKMLEILIHFELKNFQLAENLIRNVERQFKADHSLSEQELFFFKSFKQLLKYAGQPIPASITEEILSRWEEISTANNKSALTSFVHWVGSKVVALT